MKNSVNGWKQFHPNVFDSTTSLKNISVYLHTMETLNLEVRFIFFRPYNTINLSNKEMNLVGSSCWNIKIQQIFQGIHAQIFGD